MGLTASTADAMFKTGIDVITSATTSGQAEMYQQLEHDERILRPQNYGADGVPGRGGHLPAADGTDVAVLNFQVGRT